MLNLFGKKTVLTEAEIISALKKVKDNDIDVIEAGLISGIKINEGKISFVVTIKPQDKNSKAWLQQACEKAVSKISGVKSVVAIMTADKPQIKPAVWNSNRISGIAKIIAVSSGKGGVGKSTTTVNLAHSLYKIGKKVGLLDADIYGPSIPKMLGINGQPEIKDNKIIPLVANGIKCMSIGFLVGEDSAVIWRGPQATKALNQMLRDVEWEELDYLLIDMPPGTGDIHLSLAQQVPVDGVVIVTTPQEVALADARKSIEMFKKVNVPIIGIIENMSGFVDKESGKTHYIFGEGGGKKLGLATGSPFLGTIPIDISLRESGDAGIVFPDDADYYGGIIKLLP